MQDTLTRAGTPQEQGKHLWKLEQQIEPLKDVERGQGDKIAEEMKVFQRKKKSVQDET